MTSALRYHALLRQFPGGIAFVDIETNGGPSQRASITEIGIVQVDEDGVREWSTLLRPESRIPDHIRRLTGIDDGMVADAPRFAEIADEVFNRLDGRLFVAHNARFDHGHLRAAFRRAGLDMRPPVLCTVKLSRRLFPEHRHHALDHLISRHGLVVTERHRALGDARLLWQFLQKLHERFPPAHITDQVRALVAHRSLPSHLDAEQIEALPDTPGVYLFYGERDGKATLPLYIGKSTRLRSRVLSHFAADHQSDRELSLSQQVRRIDWIETAGEVGALLKEAELIKRLQPTHNRQLRRNRDLCTWRLAADLFGESRLELVHAEALDFGRRDNLYGLFRTRREASDRLRTLARDHALCPPLLGLEKHTPGMRCFDFQLKRCHGACNGAESAEAHGLRMLEALQGLKLESWPWSGPIALREGGELYLVDGWRYLGSARNETGMAELLERGRPAFDMDVYKILVKATQTLPVIVLPSMNDTVVGSALSTGAAHVRA